MLQLVAHLLHLADDPQMSEKGAPQPDEVGGEKSHDPEAGCRAMATQTHLMRLVVRRATIQRLAVEQ